MKKLYMVTCMREVTFAVIAESEDAARTVAEKNASDEASDAGVDWTADYATEVASREDLLRDVYDKDEIEWNRPAGESEGRTISQWCDILGFENDEDEDSEGGEDEDGEDGEDEGGEDGEDEGGEDGEDE